MDGSIGSDGDGVLVHMWAPQSATGTIAMQNVVMNVTHVNVSHQNGGWNGIGAVYGAHFNNGTVDTFLFNVDDSVFDSNYGDGECQLLLLSAIGLRGTLPVETRLAVFCLALQALRSPTVVDSSSSSLALE